MIPADQIRTIGVVGTGAIGVSWIAFGLARGLRVVAWDPADGAEERARRQLGAIVLDENVENPREGQQFRPGLSRDDRLEFVGSLAEVAELADLVLESGPERLETKREIFAALDAAAAPDVLLTSSSSGLMPSDFQDACTQHPERVLVAHPFNPPHLMPLVEVVGGRLTSEDAAESAMEILRHLGKQPIRLHQEVPGHVANRLQAALWREAYSLVDRGVCSVADIDAAISSGPGLRWSLLGPFATQHVSGGPGGLEHVLEHLGPPMVAWWDTLGHPELTPELAQRLVAGVTAELAERGDSDVPELVARRDRALQQLMDLKAELGLD